MYYMYGFGFDCWLLVMVRLFGCTGCLFLAASWRNVLGCGGLEWVCARLVVCFGGLVCGCDCLLLRLWACWLITVVFGLWFALRCLNSVSTWYVFVVPGGRLCLSYC